MIDAAPGLIIDDSHQSYADWRRQFGGRGQWENAVSRARLVVLISLAMVLGVASGLGMFLLACYALSVTV